jgi:hypothetical protein
MQPPRDDGEKAAPAAPPAPATEGETFVVASHRALFTAPAATSCDACGAPLPAAEGDDHGYRVPGEGIYMWTRGENVRFDRAPLCADCASAIGVTALGRWEIEEEEG